MLYISISSSLLPNTFQRREVNNTIGTIILIYVSVAIGMYNLLGSVTVAATAEENQQQRLQQLLE